MSASFADARRLMMLAAAALSLTAAGAPVSNTDLVPLSGSVHQFARAQFDAGEAPSTLRPSGLDIVFTKTPEQEHALQQLLAAQQDPKSPEYHKWLTPAQYGARFGASDATLAAVTNWLKSNGLAVGRLPPVLNPRETPTRSRRSPRRRASATSTCRNRPTSGLASPRANLVATTPTT